MAGLLYGSEPNAGFVFVVLTLILGGAAAWATGRAIASTWRPFAQVPAYLVPLTAAIRFLHYALFAEQLTSFPLFVVAYVILFAFAFGGFRRRRSQQMTTQYSWVFRAAGPFGWIDRDAA